MITRAEYLAAVNLIDAYHEEQRKLELGEKIVPLEFGVLPKRFYSKILKHFACKGISPRMVTLNHISQAKPEDQSLFKGVSAKCLKKLNDLLAENELVYPLELIC